MQAQREFPPSLTDVKDKFLVQYCVVGPEVREVAADVRQTKLRVVLVRFAATPNVPRQQFRSAPGVCY